MDRSGDIESLERIRSKSIKVLGILEKMGHTLAHLLVTQEA